MVTLVEMIISFVIALLFVSLFKVQKMLMPQSYFASSHLIVNNNVSWRMIAIRILLVFFFGLVSFLVIGESEVILLGVSLGSFLIVWPVFLAPREVYYMVTKRTQVVLIFLSHIIFIIASFAIVFLSIELFPILSNFAISKIKELPGTILLWLVVTVFGYPLQGKIASFLEQNVLENNEEEDE